MLFACPSVMRWPWTQEHCEIIDIQAGNLSFEIICLAQLSQVNIFEDRR